LYEKKKYSVLSGFITYSIPKITIPIIIKNTRGFIVKLPIYSRTPLNSLSGTIN